MAYPDLHNERGLFTSTVVHMLKTSEPTINIVSSYCIRATVACCVRLQHRLEVHNHNSHGLELMPPFPPCRFQVVL